jgi:myo-inositol 2-dehydrogenase/D-chiro-inositol 1-dehydrogenase
MRPLGVGIVGCGEIAQKCHLPTLGRLREARAVALADTDAERLYRAGERFGIERRHADYRALLADATVEAVAVLVPARLHVEVALAALEAGKHVLIEKPLALSLAECDRLIERAARSDRAVLVGFNTRWHPLVRRARDVVRCGLAGPLRMVRTTFACLEQHVGNVAEWRKRRALGGGGLLDMAIHHFDLWRFLLEREANEVTALLGAEEADDELGVVSARMDGGVLATESFVERTAVAQEIELLGRAGRVAVSCHCFDGLHIFPLARYPGDARTRLAAAANTLRALPGALLRRTRRGDYGASFLGEWRHFIDCVRCGARPECTPTDGRRALEIAIAAAQSDATGRAVRVADVPDCAPPRPAKT